MGIIKGFLAAFTWTLVAILMTSAKLTTLGLLRIKVFWNKRYDVKIYVHDVINKVLSRDSNNIVDVVMWAKFSNSNISMREVIKIIKIRSEKYFFFEGCSSIKFNNLGLALDVTLKFYIRVVKGLKRKVRNFWKPIPTFVEVTGEKLLGRALLSLPKLMNSVKHVSKTNLEPLQYLLRGSLWK